MTSTTPTTSQPAIPAAPPPSNGGTNGWSIEESRELYSIEGWSAGYFDINEAGRVFVRPDANRADQTLDLFELANDLEQQGIALPVLVRFSEVLRSRIHHLHEKFAAAIEEFAYTGGY